MADFVEVNGRRFSVRVEYDDSGDAPWDRADGHGPVSDWRRASYTGRPDKRPGEMVLNRDRGSARLYDFAEATRIAKRDGWGIGAEAEAELAQRLGRAPTRREIVREAVMRDYEYLRAWCNDEWWYVGVIVAELDSEGEETGKDDSLWGVESGGDYWREVALEMAEGIEAESRAEAAAKIAALDSEAVDVRRHVLQVLADMRAVRAKLDDSGAVRRLCAEARRRVTNMLEDIATLRAKRDALRAEWVA